MGASGTGENVYLFPSVRSAEAHGLEFFPCTSDSAAGGCSGCLAGRESEMVGLPRNARCPHNRFHPAGARRGADAKG